MCESLRHRIQRMPIGARLPSLRSLVKRYGMSLQSVNFALKQLQAEGLVDIRHGSGVYVSSQKAVRCIEFHRPQYPSVQLDRKELSLGKAVAKAGWKMIVKRHDPTYDDPIDTPDPGAAAHIVSASLVDPRRSFFNLLLQQKVPVLAYGRESGSLDLDYVTGNDLHGIMMLLKHLRELGHRRLGLIVNEPEYYEVAQRRTMFLELAETLDFEPPCVVECGVREGEDSQLGAWRGLWAFLANNEKRLPFTAAVVASAAGAAGVLRAFHEAGIRVPHDCSLASCCGFEGANALLIPSVTEVGVPLEAWGETAAQVLQQRFDRDPGLVLATKIPCRLDVRESTGSAPKVHARVS
ncbi:MAG: substrate-binding domain-containing protein [Chthoniobacterales bacterium]|nr:substrate-binding domain-containing protein [Chthoniobacterales bacterium]